MRRWATKGVAGCYRNRWPSGSGIPSRENTIISNGYSRPGTGRQSIQKSVQKQVYRVSELAYITTLLLSISQRGLSLNPEELELLDQALGLVMMKSAE